MLLVGKLQSPLFDSSNRLHRVSEKNKNGKTIKIKNRGKRIKGQRRSFDFIIFDYSFQTVK